MRGSAEYVLDILQMFSYHPHPHTCDNLSKAQIIFRFNCHGAREGPGCKVQTGASPVPVNLAPELGLIGFGAWPGSLEPVSMRKEPVDLSLSHAPTSVHQKS